LTTKLCIPFDITANGKDGKVLIVRSTLRIRTLSAWFVSKLMLRGISKKEYIAMFWLGERLKPLPRAKIYYLLTLWTNLPKKRGIYNSFPVWFWSHQNLDKAFPSLSGDFKAQCSRLLKSGQVKFAVEQRTWKSKSRELRWMGVGYRDKGSLANYKVSWDDCPEDELQVRFEDLFARLTDNLLDTHIERARRDLRTFRVSVSRPRKRSKPTEECLSDGTKHNKFNLSRELTEKVERIRYGN
jgi:hypothetical protein